MEHLGPKSVYVSKFQRKINQFNHSFQLPEYFREMIGNKKEVVIAELGAALVNTIGDSWPGVKVTVIASDVMQEEYKELLDKNNVILHTPIEYQDMENTTYPDETFDIVHCVNALDHTLDAERAIKEMKRICKPGGWIYLRHSQNQKTRFGGHHEWDIYMWGTKARFDGKDNNTFYLNDFKSKLQWDGKEDLIVSTWQKI